MASTNYIQSLAGALASVTCKEPLRMSFSKNMKDFLTEKKIDMMIQEEIAKMKFIGDLLNIGCNYIFNFVQKKAAENVLQDETIIKEIEKRKSVDANGIKMFSYEINSPLTKIVNKLPPLLKPNINGLTKIQLSIYNNSLSQNNQNTSNNDIAKINYSLVKEILHILKEVLENNITTRNYEICMQNVKTIITNNSQNNNEFEEGSEELVLCEKAIKENKLKELNMSEQDEMKIIRDMTIITFKHTYSAFESQNKKLFNIFIAFLKGWIKSSNLNIRKVITDKLLGNINHQCFSDLAFHAYLINSKILDLNEYQNLILSYLENSTISTRPYFIKLINDLKKFKINDSSNPSSIKLPKIYDFYYKEDKCNKYFTLFGKYCKLPSDLNFSYENSINYKVCNIKNQKTYEDFTKICYLAFTKIISTRFPYLRLEQSELSKNLGNFIQSPFISNDEQLNVFIMLITELCTKKINAGNDLDSYPDTGARCVFTLLMAIAESSNKMRMFTITLNGIYRTFHYDYMKSTFKFNQRPYFKFLYFFIHFFSSMPIDSKLLSSEKTKMKYMSLIAQYLRYFSPQYYPGFALAWLELISSEIFMSCFLGDINNSQTKEKNEKNNDYLSLISEIFIFLRKCSNKQVNKPFMDYVFKFIYLLCNTYPEFIIENHYIILISLPYENIYMQIKNLILSTIPKKLEQYKYLNFEDKILENEINNNILEDYNFTTVFDIDSILKKFKIHNYLEKYKENPNFELRKNICNNLNQNNNLTFNFYVIQSIVIYYYQNILPRIKNISEAHIFFLDMVKLLENNNRILLINSLLNQLKFPSKQTLYFVIIILNILSNLKDEAIEENIITLLLERLFVKPIPWGIDLLFKKLSQGDKYDLMNSNYFKNFNGGDWFINRLKEFLENKNL